LAEAEELAALARAKGVLGVVGTQARVAPGIEYLRHLIAGGFVGEALSTTLVARGLRWGDVIPSVAEKNANGYTLDSANGATMLTIPFGHTMAALRDVFGEMAEVSAVLATRRTSVPVVETGEQLPVSAPDQLLVSGVFASGVPISVHYRGGTARDGNGLFWETNGTKGDIRVTGVSGHPQMEALSLSGVQDGETAFRPLEFPASYRTGWPEDPVPGNVARLYSRMAQDMREGTRTAPSFDDAVAVHRVIAAIEQSAESRSRTALI
jgi:predicted dehydrogenase